MVQACNPPWGGCRPPAGTIYKYNINIYKYIFTVLYIIRRIHLQGPHLVKGILNAMLHLADHQAYRIGSIEAPEMVGGEFTRWHVDCQTYGKIWKITIYNG
jgi:hypothetical protein